MESDQLDAKELMATIAALRTEVASLRERMTAFERVLPQPLGSRAAPANDAPPSEQLSEELVLTISAAVAAYLGVKPHIRQIRLLRSEAWAQHGRVTVQASHALTKRG